MVNERYGLFSEDPTVLLVTQDALVRGTAEISERMRWDGRSHHSRPFNFSEIDRVDTCRMSWYLTFATAMSE